MSWKTIKSKRVYKNKWMEVTEDTVDPGDGKHITWGVVKKEPFTLIIPWDGEKFTLVGQYRYPIDTYTWEFPQGHFEHDSILATAQHELEEETGLRAKKN